MVNVSMSTGTGAPSVDVVVGEVSGIGLNSVGVIHRFGVVGVAGRLVELSGLD
jgi:uridine phosphorylase